MPQHAVHLMRGHSLFARAHQECGHQPLVERDVATLEHGSDHDRELAAAFLGVALELSGARLNRRGVVHRAAVPATGPSAQRWRSSQWRALVRVVKNLVRNSFFIVGS